MALTCRTSNDNYAINSAMLNVTNLMYRMEILGGVAGGRVLDHSSFFTYTPSKHVTNLMVKVFGGISPKMRIMRLTLINLTETYLLPFNMIKAANKL